MVHQFKLARQNPEVKVHYVIPEANPGYQMMLRSGKNLVYTRVTIIVTIMCRNEELS